LKPAAAIDETAVSCFGCHDSLTMQTPELTMVPQTRLEVNRDIRHLQLLVVFTSSAALSAASRLRAVTTFVFRRFFVLIILAAGTVSFQKNLGRRVIPTFRRMSMKYYFFTFLGKSY
jgi:hypothetical protein